VVKNVLNYVKLKPVKSTETRICQNFSLLQKAKQKFTGHTCLLERSNNSWHKGFIEASSPNKLFDLFQDIVTP